MGTKVLTLWRHTLSLAVSPEITLQIMKCAKTKNCKHSSSHVILPIFREIRDASLHAHSGNVIDDEEFVLLFYLNTSKNLNIGNIIILKSWSLNKEKAFKY